jgi:hypothetical protein
MLSATRSTGANMTENNEVLTNYEGYIIPDLKDWIAFFVYAGNIHDKLMEATKCQK